MTNIFFQGLLLQASLILALGAQNIFVLHSGLKKNRHLLVATICSLCDTLLVFTGVLGVSTFFIQIPALKIILGIIGISFLFYYGLLKLKEAKNGVDISSDVKKTTSAKEAILTSLGFSLLNPHVYLDTIVLIGGYSTKFYLVTERLAFGAGASLFSIIWFYGLSLLATLGSRLLNNPRAMSIISLLSGIILILLSFKLAQDVLSWIMLALRK